MIVTLVPKYFKIVHILKLRRSWKLKDRRLCPSGSLVTRAAVRVDRGRKREWQRTLRYQVCPCGGGGRINFLTDIPKTISSLRDIQGLQMDVLTDRLCVRVCVLPLLPLSHTTWHNFEWQVYFQDKNSSTAYSSSHYITSINLPVFALLRGTHLFWSYQKCLRHTIYFINLLIQAILNRQNVHAPNGNWPHPPLALVLSCCREIWDLCPLKDLR
jgi:hypothetical protein